MIEQRKTVSVVFADLVESTSLAERLDPEVLAAILQRYFARLRAVVEKHGGSVEKFIGDAVVGVFGIPTLHEDDALRAVRAALDIQQAMTDLNDELGERLGGSLRVRVGVNTGEVVVSAQNPLGHAISMAARLEQNASPGDVLMGKETVALVRDTVEVEPIAALTVKGSSEPLAAWRAIAMREVVPRGSRAGSVYVGRERELRQIASAYEQAAGEPACVTVTIVAPPGLGKSRLIAEGVRRVGNGARVLVGRCLPYGGGTYAALVEAVRQIEVADGVDALDRLLAGTPDGDQVLATVRATLTGAARGSPDETAWAFRRLFETMAAQRALIVVVDDIHWADSVLLDLVEYVGTFCVGSPILLLCAARPDLFDTRPGWSAPRDNAQQLRLAPLNSAETEGLLAAIETPSLDEDARRRIVETSGGVPLFVEQMAAFDAEHTGQAQIPPTIRALLAARVDRVAPDERAVLERAAIQGSTFRRDTLAQLMPEEARDSLGGRLMALIRREFIRPDAMVDGHDTFAFNHALIRDAVYEAMTKRSRAELHERYADILEASGGTADEVVAHHLDQAYIERASLGESSAELTQVGRRAGLALTAAGRRATARKETSRAVDLLSRASDLLTSDPTLRVRALPDLIDALVAAASLDGARAVYGEAVALARSLGDETSELRAEMAWGITEPRSDATGWQERLLGVIDRALEHFSRTGDDASMAEALLLKGLALAPHDQLGAIAALGEAQVHAERSGDERIQVEVWDELGGAMIFGPTPYSETLEFTRREVDWARRNGIAFAAADGRLGEAYSLAALGEFDHALAVLDELIEFFAQLPGRVSQHGECYTLAGRIERDRGDSARAVELYRAAMAVFERSGHRRWWRNAAPGVAHALLDLDRVVEARAVLDEIALHDATSDGAQGAFRLEAEARYLSRTGDSDGGIELAQRAVSAVADTAAPLYEGRSRETLAGLLLAAGDAGAARSEFERARSLYLGKGYLPGISRIDGVVAQTANFAS